MITSVIMVITHCCTTAGNGKREKKMSIVSFWETDGLMREKSR